MEKKKRSPFPALKLVPVVKLHPSFFAQVALVCAEQVFLKDHRILE